jgi:hypothetical protein
MVSQGMLARGAHAESRNPQGLTAEIHLRLTFTSVGEFGENEHRVAQKCSSVR